MPPSIPYFILAILFGYCLTLSIKCFLKFRDWTSLSLSPSLLYWTVFFLISQHFDRDVALIAGRYGFLLLSVNILITITWRYLVLKESSWTK